MQVSIEVPVFKGRFLRPCVDSVLAQTSDAWTLSLYWNGGDEQSRTILERLQHEGDARVRVFFGENRGIAGGRKLLTDHSEGDYILPLDDDDILCPRAVERFLQVATGCPWASLIRARRVLIDVEGNIVEQEPWFPFGPRSYDRGMVTDIFNQSQPYLIRRSAYNRTRGWTGFPDFMGAGEDCDIFLQLEEVAHFEFIDEVLYEYRLHDGRASLSLTNAAAFEMWRRLCDGAITRIGLPLKRVNDTPPFVYERLPRRPVTLEDVNVVTRGTDGASTWRMAGFRATQRPVVCFLGEHADIQTFIRTLNDTGADLLAPSPGGKILLVRREVVAATGGFDEQYVPASSQAADFWIQARRRGFSCVGIPPEGDLGALRSKWRSHTNLLPSS
ncbi:MAG: hypothetical protein DMF56_19450 [Acidobacteria bacterium]|nr:MAG: hypothetical protein DMF56_19450 [Acidobacteriota bacterium]